MFGESPSQHWTCTLSSIEKKMHRRPHADSACAIVPRGTLVNVRWKEGWYVGRVQNHTLRGTHVRYTDGQSKYHVFLEEEYTVLATPIEVHDETRARQELHKVGKEVLKCCICLDVCRNPVTAACMHSFCEECVLPLFKTKECPFRCADVRINSMRDLRPNPTLRALCEVLVPRGSRAAECAPKSPIVKRTTANSFVCRRCRRSKRYAAEPCSCRS